MRAALEVCGEFLSRIGALQDVGAIAEMMHKSGMELAETSSFRWRALLAAIRHELDAEPMDSVFLFERLLQLDVLMPTDSSLALFRSPLFLHLVVERFAVAFEGLDAELFKLESDELCHVDGLYETCLLVRDKIRAGDCWNEKLGTFLETFKQIFEHNEPKECWDVFYESYQLKSSAFRRDMKRALCMIESAALGPTKLELAFPTEITGDTTKAIPRAMLERRFVGTRREWRDMSHIISISNDEQEQQEQQQQDEEREARVSISTDNVTLQTSIEFPEVQDWVWPTNAPSSSNNVKMEVVHSDVLDESPTLERPESSRPPRAAEVARVTRREGRRAVARTRVSNDDDVAITSEATDCSTGRRKRVRWSTEEEEALIEGYRLYHKFSNVWMLIKTKFPDVLRNRSNVDLKDKFRNLRRYNRILRATADGHDNAGVTDNDATDDNTGAADKSDATDT
uniref:Myb-like domain-containing protein n=1 Tax=Peronospora matthiolae TaxID=2874970 RepID=A0AAV1V9M8_9STRA